MAPPTEAAEVDVLRRAAGLSEPFHVAPHLTLVPPVNVAEVDLPTVMVLLRRVAAAAHPVDLDVGPVATFLPETPTLHLTVGGADVDCLRSLRGHLRSGPFDRPDVWPFNPHVTICEHAEPALIDSGLVAFASFRQRWRVASVHLLEQRRHGPGHPMHGRAHWVPVREEPLGGATLVGRGGVELSLRTVGLVEPEVGCLLGIEPVRATDPFEAARTLLVVAEQPTERGTLLGAVAGRLGGSDVAELERVVVAAEHRNIGIGRQLVNRWCAEVAVRGARIVLASDLHDGTLQSLGFEAAGGVLLRRT